MNEITIRINDRSVTAFPGQSIMQAADSAGIVIPRLCFHPAVRASGACRLCAVEIEGYRGLPAACSTEVAEGMRIDTGSPRVLDFRREMLLAILKEHPRECLACPRNGTCELQQLVRAVGIDFPYEIPTVAVKPAQPGGPYFERDYRLCVHCGRCVRVCHEVRGNRAIVFREVGGRQEVATQFGRSLEDAGCQFCGACVDVCPVGAIREVPGGHEVLLRKETSALCGALTDIILGLYRKQLNHEVKSSICPLCSAGCAMLFDVAAGERVLSARPDPKGGANLGQACVQGRFLLKSYLGKENGIKGPRIFRDGAMQEASWDEALSNVSASLGGCGKGEIALICDARVSNEELALIKGLAGSVLKSESVFVINSGRYLDCFRTIAGDMGDRALEGRDEDLDGADGIIVIGLNLSAANPILGVKVRQAALKGTRLLTANPVETALGRLADMNLAYYPGAEEVLLKGLLRLLLDRPDILEASCGLNRAELSSIREGLKAYDIETVSEHTGVSEELISDAACLIGEMKNCAIVFGGGFLESSSGKESLKALEMISLLRNSKERARIFPVYGDANMRGAWTAGVFDSTKGMPVFSPLDGIYAMKPKLPARVLAAVVIMRNLRQESADYLESVLEGLDYVVVIAERYHGFKTDVFLPLAGLLETGGTITDFMGNQAVAKAIIKPGDLSRALEDIIKELRARMGGESQPRNRLADSPKLSSEDATPFKCEPGSFHGRVEKRDEELPFALIGKDSLVPYFLSPLMAEEAKKVFFVAGDIEMNPADAYSMELMPGDSVRVQGRIGQTTGTLAVNGLLTRGVVALREEILRQGFPDAAPEAVLSCKVTKAVP
ncbi:MAG: molybdopterin-dependent oxidoreductase [Deltaproteobacteria bacterium]|nr:molybdopterin-dependent oxidoreductase [Deltaproteobacteria bacterium]